MKFSTLAMALGVTNARIHFFESCPSVTLADNFDKTKFAGNWYEVLRDSEFFYEMGQECTTHQYNMQDDGTMSLYFRAWSWMWGGYNGVNGNLLRCGESDDATCMSSMGGKEIDEDSLYPYNVLWINDEHDLAVNYMCSEMMMGLFTFQWWSVFSKNQAVDADSMRLAA